jgi:hypothetical protein
MRLHYITAALVFLMAQRIQADAKDGLRDIHNAWKAVTCGSGDVNLVCSDIETACSQVPTTISFDSGHSQMDVYAWGSVLVQAQRDVRHRSLGNPRDHCYDFYYGCCGGPTGGPTTPAGGSVVFWETASLIFAARPPIT